MAEEFYLDEVKEAYGMEQGTTEFIRHNENLTYCLELDQKKYLVRIHKHKDGFTTGSMFEGLDGFELRQKELEFIQYLKQCGIVVQTPVQNKYGDYVTSLKDGTLATVLTWIPGKIIDKKEIKPELCFEIGRLLYRMHNASRSLPTKEFESYFRYDTAFCIRVTEEFTRLAKENIIPNEPSNTILRTLEIINFMLGKKESEQIMVHTDFSLSNLLITEEGLVPIDFSLMGYCDPMMDLSSICCNISGKVNRQSLLLGYEKAGGTIDFFALDCLFAYSILLGIYYHSSTWVKEDWFWKRLPGWCEEIFQPLIELYGDSLTDNSENNGDRHMLNLTLGAVSAEESDIPGWMELVKLVSDNFPGLDFDDYLVTLKKNIARGSALCVKEDSNIAGILLFSTNQHCISCIAVHPEYRRHHVAETLIRKMAELMPEGDISVTTFREGDPMGTAPRALYRKLGFQPAELLTEFDYPVQKFILHRK